MNQIKLPDITMVQAAAAFAWVVGQLVIMGVVDAETSKVVLSIGLTAIAAAWKIADAIIRQGRSRIAAAAVTAGTASIANTSKGR